MHTHSSENGHSDQAVQRQMKALAKRPWQTPGTLMVIGGADRLDPESRLASLFCRLVERTQAHTDLRDIVLVSTATRHPEVLTDDYIRILTRIGVPRERIHAPLIRNHEEAHSAPNCELLANAGGIFITGGDQYILTQVLNRTPAEDAIMQAYGKGAVVAGTSAGATAMGRPMIVAGGGTGELRRGVVQMSHGLGWAGEDMIIDTHFGARGRFPRLAAAVSEHREALGLGIDENTCLLVDAPGHCTVTGAGVVYFVDASKLAYDSAPAEHTGHPISVGPLQVSALAAGGEYDLHRRRVLVAPGVLSKV